ncbi:hypothetical protein HYT32_01480 [Candidatus Roizmanbacteria bacterium]|nr:hypothetical protein [Candidatus Roizmanbacteria bacterium]
MTENPEGSSGLPDNIKDLEVQKKTIDDSINQLEAEIRTLEEPDFKKAVKIGMQYLEMQISKSLIDRKISLALQPTTPERYFSFETDPLIVILECAKEGHYWAAKEYFNEVGRWELAVANFYRRKGRKEDAFSSTKLGLGFLRISAALPDKGDPFSEDMLS